MVDQAEDAEESAKQQEKLTKLARNASTASIKEASRMFDLSDVGGWTDENFTAHLERVKQQALDKVDKLGVGLS